MLRIIIIILAMLSWGGSWTSAKLITPSVPSEIVVFWRFFITFISLIPMIYFMKASLKINIRGILQVVLGAFILVIYNLLFINGVRNGQAGEGGVIVTTLNPLFTFIVSALIFRKAIKKKETIGLLLGLIGGAILFKVWEIFEPNFLNLADSLLFFAALSWAVLTVITQQSRNNMNAFVFSFYTYGIAAFLDFFIAIPKGVFQISEIDMGTWLNILYLSIFATSFGTTAYFFAASKISANKASSFTFLVPSSAVFFSWLILDETIRWYSVVGGILALIAIYIINYKTRKRITT